MATVAVLDTVLRARTDKFNSGLKGAQSTFLGFQSKLVAGTAAITAAAAAMATAVVTRFAAMGDEIDKASKRTQLAVDDFQSLTFAFQQSGGSAASLEASVRGLNRNILDLQRGTQTAKDNFADLGLSMQDFEGLDAADRFRLAADALKGIQDEATQAGVAMKLFGRSGTELLPMLDNMQALEKQYKDLGIEMTESQINKAAELTDEWNILTQSINKLIAEMGESLFPIFRAGIKLLGGLARAAAVAADAIGKVVEFVSAPISGLFGGLSDFFFGSSKAGSRTSGSQGSKIIKQSIDAGFKKQAELQKQNIKEIEKTGRVSAGLPKVLEKGNADTLSFLNKLGTQNIQKKMQRSLETLVKSSSESLDELRKISKRKLGPGIGVTVPI